MWNLIGDSTNLVSITRGFKAGALIMEKISNFVLISFFVFLAGLNLASAQLTEETAPQKFLVIGASLSDKMGGSEAGIPLFDLIVKTNTSPGERIYRGIRERYQELGWSTRELDFDKKTLLNTSSKYFYSWIKKKMKVPQNEIPMSGIVENPRYDVIYALDLIYKDWKGISEVYIDQSLSVFIEEKTSELRQELSFTESEIQRLSTEGNKKLLKRAEYRKRSIVGKIANEKKLWSRKYESQSKKIKEIKDRIADIMTRLALHSQLTVIGTPLNGKNDYRYKDKFAIEVTTEGPQYGKEWLLKFLADEDKERPFPNQLGSKVLVFDVLAFYDEVRMTREFSFEILGKKYVVSYDKVIANDNWHPNYNGSKIISNYLIEETIKMFPDWRAIMPEIEFEATQVQ